MDISAGKNRSTEDKCLYLFMEVIMYCSELSHVDIGNMFFHLALAA